MIQSRNPRKGGAFIILVVALLIVVLGASQAMVRSEIASQRNSSERMQIDTLLRAISATNVLHSIDGDDVVLPIDDRKEVRVSRDESKNLITAKLIQDDRVLQTITRVLVPSTKVSNFDSENES